VSLRPRPGRGRGRGGGGAWGGGVALVCVSAELLGQNVLRQRVCVCTTAVTGLVGRLLQVYKSRLKKKKKKKT